MSESKFREITTALKNLEVQEDRKGLEKCEEAFREMDRKSSIQIEADTARAKDDHWDAAHNASALDWGSESDDVQKS